MTNIFKICLIGLIATMFILSTSSLYCEDDELKTYRGIVQEIDWAGSLLTVAGMDEMTFYVPAGTNIVWGTETVGLSDVLQDDPVLIKYYDNPTGTPRAVKIVLEREYAEF
ncbi:MAG: hypothetical protein Q8R38_08650 [Candidatus Omnitrophota bacterium]|nr:hypothetical protein [Candidatus Omnitrophota bacterium]